jgi:hypothetical protein
MLLTVAGFVIQAVTPAAHSFWLVHPVAAALVNAVWAKVNLLLPSPVSAAVNS